MFSIGLLACQALGFSPLAALAIFPVSSAPTLAARALPAATHTPAFPISPAANNNFEVRYHPDGQLFVGDLVSFEVIAPAGVDLEGKNVTVQVGNVSDQTLAQSGFTSFGLGQRSQATFNWVWDTSGLDDGEYYLRFSILPGQYTWIETVELQSEQALPLSETRARWETVESECCIVHYITGTDAAQDLEALLEQADAQAVTAVQRMGIEFGDPIPITVLPRVLGHGGFASQEIYISYLDDNYAGNDFSQVLHHEMIHILDGRLGGELRPSILVEGLAVYLSGGHFKKEPLLTRAAALFDLGLYIPLTSLVDSFYTSQHEVGYLEGAALVRFLVDEYGWESFENFYRGITSQPGGKQSDALDAALQSHFGITLAQLESRFKAHLERQPRIPDMVEDVRLTVNYYETVRRYQQVLDPSAYFLTAWLPDGEQMRQRGVVADYLRRPQNVENRLIETLFLQADRQLRAGNYLEAQKALSAVNILLGKLETDGADPLIGVSE